MMPQATAAMAVEGETDHHEGRRIRRRHTEEETGEIPTSPARDEEADREAL